MNDYEIKTFLVPKTFDADNAAIEVASRKPEDIPIDVLSHKYIKSVWYYTSLVQVTEYQGEKIELTSPKMDISDEHFYGAKLINLDDLKREMTSFDEYNYDKMLEHIKQYDESGKAVIDRFKRLAKYAYYYENGIFLPLPEHHKGQY